MIEVTDKSELTALHADPASLDRPFLFSQRIGSRIHFYANADDLRAWRAAREIR
jgi:hypothetical protein